MKKFILTIIIGIIVIALCVGGTQSKEPPDDYNISTHQTHYSIFTTKGVFETFDVVHEITYFKFNPGYTKVTQTTDDGQSVFFVHEHEYFEDDEIFLLRTTDAADAIDVDILILHDRIGFHFIVDDKAYGITYFILKRW